MKTLQKTFLLVASIVSLCATAGESATVKTTGTADPAMMAVIQNLKKAYPTTQFKEIQTTPLPGIYQVVMGRNVAFVDDSGRYFIFGHMFDMKEQRDLTEEVASTVAKVDFAGLPVKDAITTIKGSGARKMAVFMDPDCPYCKRLEKTLARLDDVTIYTYLFPLDALHPEARSKSVSVWCANDRAKAWSDLMTRGIIPAAGCNDNPLDRNARLAAALGINGTPTIIFPNGNLLPGAPRAEQLEKLLGEVK